MVINFRPADPFFRIEHEASPDEILGFLADALSFQAELVLPCHFEQSLCRPCREGESAIEHLVVDNADGPNIHFKVISKSLHYLGSHCQIASQLRFRHFSLSHQLFAEAQVHDFAYSVMKHHVFHLEISMHCPHFVKPLEAV